MPLSNKDLQMNNTIDFKTIWHSAGIPGVVLAAVSTAYLLINFQLTQHPFTGSTVLVFCLDLAKIVACIWLMYRFLTKFKEDYEEATVFDVKRLGKWIALLSALIFAALSMALNMMHPELVEEAFDTLLQTAGDNLDRNSLDAMEKMQNYYPQIVFVSQFIYCSLFGWILSAILARKVAPVNPFAEGWKEKKNNEEE